MGGFLTSTESGNERLLPSRWKIGNFKSTSAMLKDGSDAPLAKLAFNGTSLASAIPKDLVKSTIAD
jgi:hypothetical protein